MKVPERHEGARSRVLLPTLADMPGHLLWRARARIDLAIESSLPEGVDLHAYATLLALSGGASRTQQELADLVSVSRTTMVKVAATLADQGLVERVRSPDDRRSYALTRTPRGAAAARRWRRHAEAVESSVTSGLTVAERSELRRLLLAPMERDLVPETPEALSGSTAFLLSRLHQRLHREASLALREIGMEPRHLGVLGALEAMGTVSQAELGRALGISGPSVVEIVDSLEQLGVVERRRSPADRRSQILHLVEPAARRRFTRARALTAQVLDREFEPLTPSQVDRLVELLRRFVTAP